MSDLNVLAELKKAEESYRSRIDKAKKKAERILSGARNDANTIIKEGLTKGTRDREEDMRAFEEKVQTERKERLDKGKAELLKQHPDDNENIDKAVEWLVDSIPGWLSMRGG